MHPLWKTTWGRDSRQHFDEFRSLLDALEVPYIVNPRLVRGLDYYSHTVFEWITDELGAQGTICAGGRYDGLVEIPGRQALARSRICHGAGKVGGVNANAGTVQSSDATCLPGNGRRGSH